MIMDIGPFRFYRVDKSGTLDVSLPCCEGQNWGWEYGYRDDARGDVDKPWIQLRIGKLLLLYYEPFKNGSYEAWFLGFWHFGGQRNDKSKR